VCLDHERRRQDPVVGRLAIEPARQMLEGWFSRVDDRPQPASDGHSLSEVAAISQPLDASRQPLSALANLLRAPLVLEQVDLAEDRRHEVDRGVLAGDRGVSRELGLAHQGASVGHEMDPTAAHTPEDL
jgi:hypothetical protein